MDKVYISPSVKLINSTEGYVGFFLWMKSRQKVITDLSGNHFMEDCQLSNNWFYSLPKEFIVGSEKVNRDEYYAKIDKQNLQYNNSEYMLFEINGSCLFRDILFTLTSTTQWAESNRFLFSILDEIARFDSKNYHISAEYKDIPEWERQFEVYMDAIKSDPIVDHNRREMPYSISSKFWWGCNRRQLRALLSWLKFNAPFFYKIYGRQLMSQSDIESDMLTSTVDSYIDQFRLSSDDDYESNKIERVEYHHGDVYAITKIGLILFSQFVRQTESSIKGYLDLMEHEDCEAFSHKVFKGDTIFDIVYRAPKTKVKKTIQTRLCSFAMSSGDDPCSWSYFLNHFIPENMSPDELKELLPCKFHGNKLVHCKFREDIKFRNEGKEISNCPCPLVSLSLADAQAKKDRDNNRIGNAFYNLTLAMISDGLVYSIDTYYWTSNLVIRSDKKFDSSLCSYIANIASDIQSKWPYSNDNPFDYSKYHITQLEQFSLDGDPTCMLKGLMIDLIYQKLIEDGHTRFMINFGGDIYLQGAEYVVQIDGTKFQLRLNGNYSIFTSGNTDKRGDHIIGGEHGRQSTVVKNWGNATPSNCMIDILATKWVAKEYDQVYKISSELGIIHHIFDFKDGMMLNNVYGASPFFNPDQIKIRDKMISQFTSVFRPDQTESSKQFEFGDSTAAIGVVNENLYGIDASYCTVFPMHTNDLGTLFEVGRTISKEKPVIVYDEVNDRYTICCFTKEYLREFYSSYDANKKYLFNCSRKRDVISLGMMSSVIPARNLYYELRGAKDNLMLSVYYNHVELVNGNYELQIRDENDRDE